MRKQIWNAKGERIEIFAVDLPQYERLGWKAEPPKPKKRSADKETD